MHLTANLPRNLPVKNFFLNRLRFDSIMVMSLWPHFFGPPCVFYMSLSKSVSSTQPCIPPGSLNRVPASAGVRAGMSALPDGR